MASTSASGGQGQAVVAGLALGFGLGRQFHGRLGGDFARIGDDEAKRELKTAKQKLAALEGGQKASPITAGLDGKLSGFNVTVGSVLKAGDVIVIRYEGPKGGPGMREMLAITAAIKGAGLGMHVVGTLAADEFFQRVD
jgi:hypothetical protein